MTATVQTRSSARAGGSAWRYVLRWAVGPMVTIFVSALLIYLALSLSPGDPIAQMLGSRATDQQRQALRETLGLDQPVIGQFWQWFTGALRGDFGTSLTYKQDVASLLAPRLGVTLTLVGMATLLVAVIGLAIGIVGGVLPRVRTTVTVLISLMISIPSFVAASLLTAALAVNLRLFPTFGAGDPGLDRLWHLTLPAIALSVGFTAYLAQISVASISEERGKEHVMTAIGRGLPKQTILFKHILRNAGITILTTAGLLIAALVAGAIVVETAFGVDGLGSLLVKSVLAKDVPVVTAISVIIVIVFVVMTTIVDVLQVVLDPKLREAGR